MTDVGAIISFRCGRSLTAIAYRWMYCCEWSHSLLKQWDQARGPFVLGHEGDEGEHEDDEGAHEADEGDEGVHEDD